MNTFKDFALDKKSTKNVIGGGKNNNNTVVKVNVDGGNIVDFVFVEMTDRERRVAARRG